MAATYVPNPVGIEAMLRRPFVVKALTKLAEEGKKRAEAISPERTGRYRWGTVRFDTNSRIVAKRRRTKRAGPGRTQLQGGGGFHVEVRQFGSDGRPFVRLINDTAYAYFLEHGTRYMRKQRILGRAIDSMRI